MAPSCYRSSKTNTGPRKPFPPVWDGAAKMREVVMAFLGEEGKLTRFADFGRAAQWLLERAPPVRAVTQAVPGPPHPPLL